MRHIRFSRQKLLIYSSFWTNYSISLQKSSLRTYFLYMIRYIIFLRPPRPRANNLGVVIPLPQWIDAPELDSGGYIHSATVHGSQFSMFPQYLTFISS